MIEPILSLSFSMHSNKGVYALLLGSGISRSAGIPTGWEVVLDLIRKLAHLKGEDCEPDPAAWYTQVFGKEPDYSELLDELAKSPAERNGLLRAYFEPTDEERDHGLKVPADVHKAIAELAAKGYVRVILTTNFDHLLEEALDVAGVRATVIRTPDAAEGAVPLIHSSCTVVKLHGDYLDTRIKNTPEELTVYDPRINGLLDRVFDEFGLVVCGWSAEWDKALWSALTRCKSRRFCTYWTVRSESKEAAKRLIDCRGAQVVPIKDADAFFRQIKENVFGLESFVRPHPLSAKVAVANLKRYIMEDRHIILLHDLISEETERVHEKITGPDYSVENVVPDANTIPARAASYESVTDTLWQLVIHGCRWGNRQHEQLWTGAVTRLANPERGFARSYYDDWKKMARYPALLLLYGGGIAAMAGSQFETVVGLLTRSRVVVDDKEYPAMRKLCPSRVMTRLVGELLPGQKGRSTPTSEHLRNILLSKIRELVPSVDQYDRLFDRFEYILAIAQADYFKREKLPIGMISGRFFWRNREYGRHISTEIGEELAARGSGWPFLVAGLCDGSFERLQEAKALVDEFVSRMPSR